MLSEEKRIKTRQQLRDFLEAEYARYPISGRRSIAYLLQISEGAVLRKHTKLLRTTEYHVNTGHRLRSAFYWARLMRLQNRYALHIPLNCFDKGLNIFHIAPLVINGEVAAGRNCTLLPNASVVGKHTGSGAPVLGDNVTVGIGSTVLGDVYLADGITVAAGAVVTKSFYEPGITLAGVPAKKIDGED